MTAERDAADHLSRVVLTLSCHRLPCVVVLGLPANLRNESYLGELADAAAAFTTTLGRPVEIVEGELYAAFDDPVELLVAAKAHEVRPMRFAISASAMPLLLEHASPAREAWSWLEIADRDTTHGLARLDHGLPLRALPDELDAFVDRSGVLLWVVHAHADDVMLVEDTTIAVYDEALRAGDYLANFSYEIRDRRLIDTDSYFGFVVDQQARRQETLQLMPGQVVKLQNVTLFVVAVR